MGTYNLSRFEPNIETPRTTRYNRQRRQNRDDSSDSSMENERWRNNYAVRIQMVYGNEKFKQRLVTCVHLLYYFQAVADILNETENSSGSGESFESNPSSSTRSPEPASSGSSHNDNGRIPVLQEQEAISNSSSAASIPIINNEIAIEEPTDYDSDEHQYEVRI